MNEESENLWKESRLLHHNDVHKCRKENFIISVRCQLFLVTEQAAKGIEGITQ